MSSWVGVKPSSDICGTFSHSYILTRQCLSWLGEVLLGMDGSARLAKRLGESEPRQPYPLAVCFIVPTVGGTP